MTAATDQMGGGYSILGTSQWLVVGNRKFGRAGFLQAREAFAAADLDVDLSGQHHIVTGANAGLGRATAEALARRRAIVHMVCRNKERGLEAADAVRAAVGPTADVRLHVLDVSDSKAVAGFATEWNASGVPVHCLVNNAGVLPNTLTRTADGLESGWATMMMQTYLLTGLLLPSLLRASPGPARVINVSSGGQYTVHLDLSDPQCTGVAHNPDDGTVAGAEGSGRAFDGRQQYAHSKRAQVMLTELWADKLNAGLQVATQTATASSSGLPSGRGVWFASMHPGWAETPGVVTSIPDFAESKRGQLRTPEEGADTIVWLAAASAPLGHASGAFWFDRAITSPDFTLAGTRSSKAEFAQLWRMCERDTKWSLNVPAAAAAAAAAAAPVPATAATASVAPAAGGAGAAGSASSVSHAASTATSAGAGSTLA